MKSLAEYLGTTPAPMDQPSEPSLIDISDSREFALAVLNSRDFREYIINGLKLGEIPAAVLIRVMDLAGWQAPAKKIELTGKDGGPIEAITEVRRIVVRPAPFKEQEETSYVTH